MAKLINLNNDNFWQVLFDEACVEGKQAERIEKELEKISITEQEIGNKAIEEFAERLKERLKGMQMAELQGEDVCPYGDTFEECPYIHQELGCQYCAREQTIDDIDEIAEQMKGGK